MSARLFMDLINNFFYLFFFRYNFQHLLAIDPDNPHNCPTIRAFKFPSACVCHFEYPNHHEDFYWRRRLCFCLKIKQWTETDYTSHEKFQKSEFYFWGQLWERDLNRFLVKIIFWPWKVEYPLGFALSEEILS